MTVSVSNFATLRINSAPHLKNSEFYATIYTFQRYAEAFMTKWCTKGGRIVPWFIASALVEFLIYYVLTLFIYNFDIIYYYLYFIERFILLAIPVAAAAIIIRRAASMLEALKMSAYIALTRLAAFIPFFYIEYVYGIYDSLEALLLSLLSSLGAVAVYIVLIFAAYMLMRCVISRRGGAEYPVRMLDLSSPATLSVLAVSLIIFVLNLAFEIYSTVLFFIENGTIYYIDEIALMIISYVFLAALLIGLHAIGILALNRAVTEENNEK